MAYNHNIIIERDYKSFGNTIMKAGNVKAHLSNADVIMVSDREMYVDEIDKMGLWKKVIFYDYRDSCELVQPMLKSKQYFKRSLFEGKDRKPIPLDRITPINHCCLNEYYEGYGSPLTYNIGCFFNKQNNNLGFRRRNILDALEKAEIPDSLIGFSTAHANDARTAISLPKLKNPFFEYLTLLHRCKIIFTAQPEPVDGDNRTWECFATRALVFKDLSYIPMQHKPVDGVHCFTYDATNTDSIKDAIEKASYYLKHEEERNRIAMAGHEFIKKYHRPRNRVQEMLAGCIKL
jgi:hypothetical protein